MKTRFLNSVVEQQCHQNAQLFIAWCLTVDLIDSDLDPTHNPDWVATRKEKELRILDTLKMQIVEARKQFLLERKPTDMKYVILQGLVEGNRFFTSHTPGSDPTKLLDGTIAYRILGYADTVDEAQTKLYGKPYPHG